MIIVLTGENAFALQTELHKLVTAFIAKYTDMGLERLDGEDVSFKRMQEALQSLPFLASKKLVILKTPGSNKQFAEKVGELLKDIAETTDVIIVEPKLDKRLSYYKFLKRATDFREFNELDPNNLAQWLVKYTKERDGSLSTNDARSLINRVGVNQQLLSNELDKLLLYDSKITHESIEELTERALQSTIFELLDATFAGNTKKAMQLYAEQRAMKVEPQQIIAMLAWQLHVLAIIKSAGNRVPDEIAREARLNPFVVRKSVGIAQRITLSQLKKLIANLLVLDVRLKSESLNADETLQNFLLTLN